MPFYLKPISLTFDFAYEQQWYSSNPEENKFKKCSAKTHRSNYRSQQALFHGLLSTNTAHSRNNKAARLQPLVSLLGASEYSTLTRHCQHRQSAECIIPDANTPKEKIQAKFEFLYTQNLADQSKPINTDQKPQENLVKPVKGKATDPSIKLTRTRECSYVPEHCGMNQHLWRYAPVIEVKLHLPDSLFVSGMERWNRVRDTVIKRGNLCSKSALRAPTDDHQSDTSGETTTSDSGRGGSEEDIQLPPLPELHEDTSRIIFKNPGAGLKSSRFVQSSYPDRDGRETIAFETFSPRTLPLPAYSGDGSRYRQNPDLQTFQNRDFQTIGHCGKAGLVDGNTPSKYHQQRRQPGLEGGGGAFKNAIYAAKSPTHSLPPKTFSEYQTSSPQRQYQGGPGFYPDDIPERLDTARGGSPFNKKSVTFHTDLTTQNLKTWDLCQKMEHGSGSDLLSATPDKNGGYSGQHYVSHPSPQGGYNVTGKGAYVGRPRSQDDDDNTTTSGSYTINPENDFDDTLPTPFSSLA
ncbi:hypothetical protein RRG08_046809 [Elysia crispata]|uniref:Uncharacterized protein n=1 Tax=Elysia crispata TaxID=231223 RepID=A0AAE0ZML3_9GAST|nr:hypothetical protein RRG08_046809 [Elysia crispata]